MSKPQLGGSGLSNLHGGVYPRTMDIRVIYLLIITCTRVLDEMVEGPFHLVLGKCMSYCVGNLICMHVATNWVLPWFNRSV